MTSPQSTRAGVDSDQPDDEPLCVRRLGHCWLIRSRIRRQSSPRGTHVSRHRLSTPSIWMVSQTAWSIRFCLPAGWSGSLRCFRALHRGHLGDLKIVNGGNKVDGVLSGRTFIPGKHLMSFRALAQLSPLHKTIRRSNPMVVQDRASNRLVRGSGLIGVGQVDPVKASWARPRDL